jgi:hypothetical protein
VRDAGAGGRTVVARATARPLLRVLGLERYCAGYGWTVTAKVGELDWSLRASPVSTALRSIVPDRVNLCMTP